MFHPKLILGLFMLVGAPAALADLPAPLHDSDFHDAGAPAREKVALGRLLFFDKILSGNQNISCATCHHPTLGSGDGLSLSSGEGASGLGPARNAGVGTNAIRGRVPRNAPPLFNLGARAFTTLFHDGRLAVDSASPSGFMNPAGDALPIGLDNLLAAQAMFPVTSAVEMAGHPHENPIGEAAFQGDLDGQDGVWAQLAARLRAIPEYVAAFAQVFDDVQGANDIRFVHAANAIAAFETVAFRADHSPFDRYLAGETDAMSQRAQQGMGLFYGSAGCSGCHAGPLQTDSGFYAIAMPQLGPGKGDGPSTFNDFGRERVTGQVADRYRFRVPSLRNVALTGPWGHAGAFGSLERVIVHHLDPPDSLDKYDPQQARLPARPDLDRIDTLVHENLAARQAIAHANELAPVDLSDEEIGLLVDFLLALTDPSSLDQGALVPSRVPSGLPLGD